MNLPSDDAMLYSLLNMKLRDFYSSLEQLCDDMEIDSGLLSARLAKAGLRYDAASNRIVQQNCVE